MIVFIYVGRAQSFHCQQRVNILNLAMIENHKSGRLREEACLLACSELSPHLCSQGPSIITFKWVSMVTQKLRRCQTLTHLMWHFYPGS